MSQTECRLRCRPRRLHNSTCAARCRPRRLHHSTCRHGHDGDGQHIKGKNGITWDFCSSNCQVECHRNAECLNRDDCPRYQEFKKIPKSDRPPDYQSQRKKWVANICNKQEKKLCCSVPKSPIFVGDRTNQAEVPSKTGKRFSPKKKCLSILQKL